MVIKVNNPATGEIIQEVKQDSEDEVKQAIKDVHHGFKNGLRSMHMNVLVY